MQTFAGRKRTLDGVTFERTAPPLSGPVLSTQHWLDLTFLHWPVSPIAVRQFFPAGTEPDVFEGQTYVGLIPFRMSRAALGKRGVVPYLGDFLETNVRLYSVDGQGRHGVVFRSLETQRFAVSVFARAALAVPYNWAAMDLNRAGNVMRYATSRRPPFGSRAAGEVTIRTGAATEPTELEMWLTARWGLHTRVAGRTVYIPNEHPAWTFQEAELVSLTGNLVEAAGIEVNCPQMLRPLYTPGVRTTFGPPQRV